MILGRLLEFEIIKIYKMLKSFTTVNQGIHHSFIVDQKRLGYDPDQFLKDSPYAFCDRELNNSISGLMEKSSDGFIGSKTLDRSKDVVLEHRNRDTGNLGGKVSGLRFPQAKQTLGFLEKYFDGPSD